MYGWALVTLHLSTRNTYPWHPKPTSQCLQRTTNDLVKQYPNCRVTFLEIPIFSIKEWNEHNKHKTPDQFKDQDLKLEEHVYNLNNKIRTTNVENNSHSPIFSTDIKNQKVDHHNKFIKRRSVNFNLYIDGILPGHLILKVWLKKITQQAIKDCYQYIFKNTTQSVGIFPAILITNKTRTWSVSGDSLRYTETTYKPAQRAVSVDIYAKLPHLNSILNPVSQ
jgi:hypothetical protein